MLQRALSANLRFPEAFQIWMSRRTLETGGSPSDARYLGARTDRDYRCCARALERFAPFRELDLQNITPDRLMEYQNARATNPPDPRGYWWAVGKRTSQGPFRDRAAAELWAKDRPGAYELRCSAWARRAGANRIRKEVALMIRILRDARLWGQDERECFVRLRPVECEMVRALTVEEQHRLLHVASGRLEFRFIYCYVIVALQTTASTNELRSLRLHDVLLQNRIIQVPPGGAKNKFRMRAIPIVTEDCAWALEELLARARSLGSTEPGHYLFPLRANPGRPAQGESVTSRYDPSRPMSDSGLKKQWDVVRKAAQLPNLRIYDLRHTGITRMAEAGVPLPVAMTFAGHMTRQSQQRYTAVCMASQRGWGATVWGDGAMRNGYPASVGSDLSGAWPPRKPVAVANQTYQHFHKQA